MLRSQPEPQFPLLQLDLLVLRRLWYPLTVASLDTRKRMNSLCKIASRSLICASAALIACAALPAGSDKTPLADAFGETAGQGEVPTCAPVDAATYPFEDASIDVAPGVCFGAAPASDAFVADVPMPRACTCAPDPPPFFGAEPVPAPTLHVDMGVGQDGVFVPYADGQWVPIIHGAQGGIHVWVAWRILLPGHTEAKVKLVTRADSRIACSLAGTGSESTWYAASDASVPGAYSNVSAIHPGVAVIFPLDGKDSGLVCGKWLALHVQIQDPVAKTWGEVRRTVRLYDDQPWKGG